MAAIFGQFPANFRFSGALHTDTQTSRLLDQLGPEGQVGENNLEVPSFHVRNLVYCLCKAKLSL